jgi:hypothetical protein
MLVLGLLACGSEEEGKPPPIGPGSGPSSLGGSAGVSTSGAGSSGDSSSGSEATADDGFSGTGPPVETGSETPCGDWAEVYTRCFGMGLPLSELEQLCDAELVAWEEGLASCRVLAEELLVCVTQQPCQAFIDWERNRAVPAECAPELEALEQTCSFVGTTGG